MINQKEAAIYGAMFLTAVLFACLMDYLWL